MSSGLRLHGLGRRAAFVRLPAGRGRPAIATRAYFPATLDAAVAQKARWMTGIALAGWDRLGWSGGLAERWMRLRDRQSLLAALVLERRLSEPRSLWAVAAARRRGGAALPAGLRAPRRDQFAAAALAAGDALRLRRRRLWLARRPARAAAHGDLQHHRDHGRPARARPLPPPAAGPARRPGTRPPTPSRASSRPNEDVADRRAAAPLPGAGARRLDLHPRRRPRPRVVDRARPERAAQPRPRPQATGPTFGARLPDRGPGHMAATDGQPVDRKCGGLLSHEKSLL